MIASMDRFAGIVRVLICGVNAEIGSAMILAAVARMFGLWDTSSTAGHLVF
jgi:hypothetical protein